MRTLSIIFWLGVLFLSLPAQSIQQIYFDRFTHYTIDDWITYAPATNITAVEIGDDYVYFGTRSGGILRYHLFDDYWDFPFTTSSGLRSNTILSLSYDPAQRRLYARTPKGVDVYNFAFEYWMPAESPMPAPRQPDPVQLQSFLKNPKGVSFPPYYRPSLRELPDFFTNRSYLFRQPDEILDPYNRVFHLKNMAVVDNFNRIWIATDGLGPAWASLVDNTLHLGQHSISNIFPRAIYLDEEAIWIGGISNGFIPSGICRWDNNSDDWQYYEAGLIMTIADHNVHAIDGTKRYVFFGTELGLVRYDKKEHDWMSFTRAQRLLSNNIHDLKIVGDRLFIATDRGLNWLDIGYHNIQRPKSTKLNSIPVFKIAVGDSSLFLATAYGIYQFFLKSEKLSFLKTHSAVMDVNIGAIGVNQDSLWFAGDDGVAFLDPTKKQWHSFPQVKMHFNDLNFTPGSVWFATDRGLLRCDVKQNYWYLYTTRDGLPSNHVYHIFVDGPDMWLATDGGVTLFNWYRDGRFE